MDISQTIANEVAALLSGNEFYSSYRDRYQFLYESYIGGEEYRLAGHLTKYQLESGGEYQHRLATTPLENHCRSVIQVYNSFLFRTPPERELGSLENNPQTASFLEDCDHDGRNLDAFMRECSTWSSVFGQVWVMVVKPNLGAGTRAEELAAESRPYLNMLTPLAVTDWQYMRMPNGKYKLAYFKYIEDINGDVRTVKEWYTDTIVTTEVNTEQSTIERIEEEENQLGYIPAVCVYNARSTVRGIGLSDISDIADAQKMIYNATSEAIESIKLDTHPSLVATPETNVGTGAGALIHMPDNLDPGLKPYALEFSGASIDSIYKHIQHTIDAIDKMANTGAVRATESRTMSGVAMETEFQLLNARLSEKADAMELAEEQIWQLFAEYNNAEWNGVIEYPGSFNIRDTQSEINQLRTAAETVGDDPQAKREIVRSVMKWMGVEEYEEMEHPQTIQGANRTAHIQEMIMEGYTDEQILGLHPEINQTDIDTAKQNLLEQ